jgi:hypothetical protein
MILRLPGQPPVKPDQLTAIGRGLSWARRYQIGAELAPNRP